MNFHMMSSMLLVTIAMLLLAANNAEASRNLQGGGVSLPFSLPGAGDGKKDLIALKCSVLGKFGISAPFCGNQIPSNPAEKAIKAVAGGISFGAGLPVYTTTDGASWSPAGNSSTSNYTRVAVSKDGSTLLAIFYPELAGSAAQLQGGLLLSTDAGSTWSTVPDVTFDYPSSAAGELIFLQPLAMSKNGSVMVVGSPNSQLWLSTDKGASFVGITDRIAAADAESPTPLPPQPAVTATAAKSKPGTVKVVAPSNSLQDALQPFIKTSAHKPGASSNANRAAATSLLLGFQGHQAKQPAEFQTYEFTSAAISDDGQTIVVTPALKRIFVSRDGGATFAAKPVEKPWVAVAVSSSGQRITAVIIGSAIYSSSDYGETWSSASVPLAIWGSIASDNSGQKLVACPLQLGALSNSSLYISTDAGVTWVDRGQGVLPSQQWSFITVASNGDGNRLLASAVLLTNDAATAGGALYSSADGGGSWSKVNVPVAPWFSVAAAEAY